MKPRFSRQHFPMSLAALFLFLVVCGSMAAQSGRGVIVGRVKDVAGAVLQGAKIDLEPKAASAASDIVGEFTITDLAPGSYTVTVSYVGFAPFSNKVNVTAGQTAHVDATLKVASDVEQITVTAERVHGEAEAINRERASDNILQVLPVEVITSLPNTNIADALGRLPSVTLERDEGEGKYVQIRGTQPAWSNVTIDGMEVPSPEGGVRQIKLDTMPANLVESVEINKTLSANQDGDAIGGSVNLVTKKAEDKPTLYFNGIGGYTPIIGGRTLYEADSTIGKRFGANHKLGILVGGSYDWNGRGIDDVEPNPTTSQCDTSGCDGAQQANAPSYPTYSKEDIREYRYYRSRYGAAGSIDYKLGEISGLYIHGIYSHFNNFGDRWVYSPNIGSFAPPNAVSNNGDGSMSFNASIRRPVDVIGGVDAGGNHVFSVWRVAYDFAVGRSSEEDHGYSTANFAPLVSSPLNAISFNVDTTNPNTPKLVPQGGVNIFDATQYYLSGTTATGGAIDFSRTYSPQINLQVGGAVSRSYTWNGHFGTLEIGGKFRNAHKFQDFVDNYYDAIDNTDPTITPAQAQPFAMTNFLSTFTNPSYYGHAYQFGPTTDYGKIRAFFGANQGPVSSPYTCQQSTSTVLMPFDCTLTQQNTVPNNYDLVERISAGYLMNTIDVGRWRLVTGVRFEGTNEAVQGNNVTLDPTTGVLATISPVNVNSSYLDPLPSVSVKYQFPHDIALRAAYGRGISRPNFSDLPPYLTHNGPNQEIDIGNPNLKPTHANNFDLLYEQYLKPLGLIQAGFFYKQLSDPIYEGVKTPITTDIYGAFYNGGNLVQPLNGQNAWLYGIEVAYQQHLTFLPGAAKGIGISANYSFTKSRTGVDPILGRTDAPALERQAPNTWNISPTYDRGPISARLGLSYNGANIFQYNYQDGAPLGIKGPNGDVYLYSHLQVDAQAAIRMYRGLQLIASGLNLTNEVFGFYQGSPQYPIQREYYKTSYMFGLRYTLSNEPK